MTDANVEESSLVQVNWAKRDQMEKWQSKEERMEKGEAAGGVDRYADRAKLNMFPSLSQKENLNRLKLTSGNSLRKNQKMCLPKHQNAPI